MRAGRRVGARFLCSWLCVLGPALAAAAAAVATSAASSAAVSAAAVRPPARHQHALHHIRRSLAAYSDDAVRRLLGPQALADPPPTAAHPPHRAHDLMNSVDDNNPVPAQNAPNEQQQQQKVEEEQETTASTTTTSTETTKAAPGHSLRGILRVRADITSSSAADDEQRPRRHRSAQPRYGDWARPPSHYGHRKRRKGCPPLHGKDQLLCPSRNAHRYDVCVSREQLCDHIVDCPDGEDEDPRQCFFYKPLDDQLKTLSHAVLLLVDNVMVDGRFGRNEL